MAPPEADRQLVAVLAARDQERRVGRSIGDDDRMMSDSISCDQLGDGPPVRIVRRAECRMQLSAERGGIAGAHPAQVVPPFDAPDQAAAGQALAEVAAEADFTARTRPAGRRLDLQGESSWRMIVIALASPNFPSASTLWSTGSPTPGNSGRSNADDAIEVGRPEDVDATARHVGILRAGCRKRQESGSGSARRRACIILGIEVRRPFRTELRAGSGVKRAIEKGRRTMVDGQQTIGTGVARPPGGQRAGAHRCTHKGLTVEGYSRAAVQTYWRVPELKLGFDLGAQPWSFMSDAKLVRLAHAPRPHRGAAGAGRRGGG